MSEAKCSMKAGVKPPPVSLAMCQVVVVAADIWSMLNKELVITSGMEGEHREGSLHHQGLALDLRSRDLSELEKKLVTGELTRRLKKLSDSYQVILEDTHIHVEYDTGNI